MAKTYPNQPENSNFLSPVGFRFNNQNLPNTNWFLTAATLPGFSLGEVPQPTPFMQTAVPGNDVNFEPLVVTFLVDENMSNWRELYDWVMGLGFPEEYAQYKNRKENSNLLSDATMTILNSNMNPNYQILFKDIFPMSVSEVMFDSASADIEGIKATATFRYLNYTYEKV